MKQLKIATDNIKAKRLFLSTKRLVTSKFLGNYKSVFRGRGLEFEGYRVYTPDDDAGLIDWRASLRANDLLVKEFVEERNLTVFFLIDCSSSMILGSTERLKSEYAAEFVTALAYAILSSGDSVGFAMFTSKPVHYSLPASGFAQYHSLLSSLVDPRLYGGEFRMSEASKFLLSYVPETSILVIVSDFLDAKARKDELSILSRKFDVIGVVVRDPLDRSLPSGMGFVQLKDAFSNRTLLVEPDAVASRYRDEARRQAASVKKMFTAGQCDFLELVTDKPFVKPLFEFFEWRAAKWR